MRRGFEVTGSSDDLVVQVDISERAVTAWIAWQSADALPTVVNTDDPRYVRAEWAGGSVYIGRHVLEHLAWHLECQKQSEEHDRAEAAGAVPEVPSTHPTGLYGGLLAEPSGDDDLDHAPGLTAAGHDALARS